MSKRVLLVDDEEELLQAMKIRLVSWGYDVVTSAGGEEALKVLENSVPDAVILDVMMPGMNGIETLRRIRELNKKLPVIMLTAYGDEKNFRETRALGIAGFIHKGADFGNVSELLRIVLKGQQFKKELSNKKILVVEDEPEQTKALQIVLRRKGFDVITAVDGQEALNKLREKPDLVLLDVLMPKLNGFEVLSKLRGNTETRRIPVIMLTAKAETGAILNAYDLGTTEYVVKPFEIEELLNLIDRYIRLGMEKR